MCRTAQMRWLHDFITEVACCLKLRWESKVKGVNKCRVLVEGRIVPAMFIEDGRDGFLKCKSNIFSLVGGGPCEMVHRPNPPKSGHDRNRSLKSK